MGSLFFHTYINDLHMTIKYSKGQQFADDTQTLSVMHISLTNL